MSRKGRTRLFFKHTPNHSRKVELSNFRRPRRNFPIPARSSRFFRVGAPPPPRDRKLRVFFRGLSDTAPKKGKKGSAETFRFQQNPPLGNPTTKTSQGRMLAANSEARRPSSGLSLGSRAGERGGRVPNSDGRVLRRVQKNFSNSRIKPSRSFRLRGFNGLFGEGIGSGEGQRFF